MLVQCMLGHNNVLMQKTCFFIIPKRHSWKLTNFRRKKSLSSGPQYGTLERAWSALCTEAEKVSELHMEVKAALMGEDYEKLKNWQRDAYHKQMIGGFKETKEADDGFRKAQKPWAKKLKEVWIYLFLSNVFLTINN